MNEQLKSSERRVISPHLVHELGQEAVRESLEMHDTGFDAETANYEGNWSELALKRMSSSDFRQKFIDWVENSAARLPDSLGRMSREKMTADEYLTRIDDFDAAHASVSSHVQYVPAEQYGENPSAHGKSTGFGEPVAVFNDANISDRQKDIIAAHEMFHSLIDSQGTGAKTIVRAGFDTNKVLEYNNELIAKGEPKRPTKYMTSPDELMARMAQLKNYYGMSGDEQFTEDHLKHAKEHYIEDTGLDNSMTQFFRMIRDKEFIDLMNKLPV